MTPAELPNSVRQWRKQRRAELLEQRHAIGRQERRDVRNAVNQRLLDEFSRIVGRQSIGFYWPIRDEIDVTGTVETWVGSGARAALPVIPVRNRPLEFWGWRPGSAMARGVWDIPVPAEREVVVPTVLVVPVLGFDDRAFRLGYGGGYYDRTLAVMDPKPFTIGVGYDAGRLETVFPQEHDIPLDVVVTEERLIRARSGP